MLLIPGLLDAARLAELNQLLDGAAFVPGQFSGGTAGTFIKDNLQISPRDPLYPRLNQFVTQAVLSAPAVQAYALPSRATPINFARYGAGNAYGDHVDAAIHPLSNMIVRTDLSFTLFLCPADEYGGGELVLTESGGERVVRGNAGDVVLYETGVVHRVNPVTAGTRRVAVGWIQSLVASHEHRAILYRLGQARDRLLAGSGRTPEFEAVNYSYENLLRMFSQP